MTITVRTITDDEVGAFTDASNLGFNAHPSPGEAEIRRGGFILDRTFAALDGDRFIGTARTFPTPLTLPGGRSVTVGAVTNVSVVPTHRRRGALTQMMRAQLEDCTSRSEPATILIASEAPIYGRFGYGPATWVASLRLQRGRARMATPAATADRIHMVDRHELRRIAPGLHDRHRAQTPGAIERGARNWDFRLGMIEFEGQDNWKKQFHAVHSGVGGTGGEPDGWVSYRVDSAWDHRFPNNTVHVDDLITLSDDAYAALWAHLLTLELVTTVNAEDRPPVEPLPWLLTDSRQAEQVHLSDMVWARLLDVPVALAGRAYQAVDHLVLEVVDDLAVAGATTAGRFALNTAVDGAACAPTTDPPDVTILVADLSAAWLGGTPLTLPAGAGRVVEHTPGAVRRFDALFLWQPAPWCNTWF